ncbi:MAG: hypothetical protein RIS36_353 [Pseudomonadota bacterium]|jgi:hypothetical protein
MKREGKNTAIYVGFDDYEQPELATPEKNLLRAILLNAIADVNRPGEFSRRAKDYLLSKEDDYIFSFQSVCSFLNINPHHILVLTGLEHSDRYTVKKPLKEASPSAGGNGEIAPSRDRL